MSSTPVDVARLVRQIPTQYPFVLVDRVLEHHASGRLVAVKNVTGTEEYFEGHFPQQPVMPGVLIMESLAQAAGIWLLHDAPDPSRLEVHVVGIDGAKFRRPVVPGDQLRLEVQVLRRRRGLCRVRGEVTMGEHRVAEATLLLQLTDVPAPEVDPTARVAAGAVLGTGVRVGPYCVVGPQVRLGARTVLESHVVIDGDTTLGADNHLYPFCSVGLEPQDLKFRGEATRLEIGDRNTIREFVTIHRGTAGGGGLTRIGSDNLLMACAHIAHDCLVGNGTIFGNGAVLAGHVEVMDHASVNAYSGIHQFCRVGPYAYTGGFTVATKDVLPFSKTVGNRAHVYGVNSIGLARRGFPPETIAAVKRAFRVLLSGRLTTTQALEQLEAEQPIAEVRQIIDFVRASSRGVILKRRRRRTSPEDDG
jgi:UDP-N-acetylglucosamine acyltransferase